MAEQIIEPGMVLVPEADVKEFHRLKQADLRKQRAIADRRLIEKYLEENKDRWIWLEHPDHSGQIVVVAEDDGVEVGYLKSLQAFEWSQRDAAGRFLVLGEPTNPAKIWQTWQGKRRAQKFVFQPGVDDVGEDFNKWRGWKYPESEQEDEEAIYLMDQHIRKVICAGNGDHYDLVIQWLAHAVRMPLDRIGVALVLRGEEGTGKGEFGKFFASLFSPYSSQPGTLRNMLERHNNTLVEKVLVYVDNTRWNGNLDDVEQLKTLVSEGTLFVNPKNQQMFEGTFSCHFILSSNLTQGAAVPAERGSRRWLILDVPADEKEDFAYHQALRISCGMDKATDPKINKANHIRACRAWMYKLNRVEIDLSLFAKIPSTVGRAQAVFSSSPSVVQWLATLLHRQEIPSSLFADNYERHFEDFNVVEPWPEYSFDILKTSAPLAYAKYWNDNKGLFPHEKAPTVDSVSSIARTIYDTIYYDDNAKTYGKQITLGNGKRPRVLTFPGLKEARAIMEAYLNAPVSSFFDVEKR
jgi:hypothetical protein